MYILCPKNNRFSHRMQGYRKYYKVHKKPEEVVYIVYLNHFSLISHVGISHLFSICLLLVSILLSPGIRGCLCTPFIAVSSCSTLDSHWPILLICAITINFIFYICTLIFFNIYVYIFSNQNLVGKSKGCLLIFIEGISSESLGIK